ncbi:MAG: SDR family oxidoreductase [Holophagaceae bacterium]|nr:SDR family oxidoreductase [Holophagaceae bacterium]
MRSRPDGKIVFITGAGSGIGHAAALRFSADDAVVVAADVNFPAVAELADGITDSGGQALAVQLEVSDEVQWEAALAETMKAFGRLDVLVACAGISFAKPVDEMSIDEWRNIMAVNLEGAFLAVKHGIRAMRGRNSGSIVLVSSASGLKATPGASAYAASKAGLNMLAKSAALECAAAKDGIRINLVVPAGVRTPMWTSMPFFQELVAAQGEAAAWAGLEAAQPLGRFATPEEIAAAIHFLASDAAATMTGSELLIDGGYTA